MREEATPCWSSARAAPANRGKAATPAASALQRRHSRGVWHAACVCLMQGTGAVKLPANALQCRRISGTNLSTECCWLLCSQTPASSKIYESPARRKPHRS